MSSDSLKGHLNVCMCMYVHIHTYIPHTYPIPASVLNIELFPQSFLIYTLVVYLKLFLLE